MADRFRNFDRLRLEMSEGKDYVRRILRRGSNVAIIAPHGGKIEPGTSEIARQIAGKTFDLYCFEGCRARNNRELHITSHNFDEPKCIAILDECDSVVAIHGREDRYERDQVYIGGRDLKLRERIGENLVASRFDVLNGGHRFPANEPMNVCNRGRKKIGVQFELPLTLRRRLMNDRDLIAAFATAVRTAIFRHVESERATSVLIDC